jgi:hypothetical protein
MFDLDQFVADCRTAIAQDPSHKFVREVVARAVSDPAAVLKGIGEPKRAIFSPCRIFFALLAAAGQHQYAPCDALIADPV